MLFDSDLSIICGTKKWISQFRVQKHQHPYVYCLGLCILFTSCISDRGYSNDPVCLSVSALTAEPFDIQSGNLAEGLTLIISRMSSKVKVTQLKTCLYVSCFTSLFSMGLCVMSQHHVWSRDVTTSRHDNIWRHRSEKVEPKNNSQCAAGGAATLKCF